MTLLWIATNELQRTRTQTYFDALRESGHTVESKDIFVMYPAYVGDSDAQARAEVLEHWTRWQRVFAPEAMNLDPKGEAYDRVVRHLDYDAMVGDNRGCFGGPQRCSRILRRIIEMVGTTDIWLSVHVGVRGSHPE